MIDLKKAHFGLYSKNKWKDVSETWGAFLMGVEFVLDSLKEAEDDDEIIEVLNQCADQVIKYDPRRKGPNASKMIFKSKEEEDESDEDVDEEDKEDGGSASTSPPVAAVKRGRGRPKKV